MGKVTGFLEYQRISEVSEAPDARKKHYREFVGHLSDDVLRDSRSMVDNLHCSSSGGVQCPVCALSKQRRQDVVHRPAPRVRVVQPNAQVSVDLHGPYATPGVKGALYAAVFVDSYSRYTWVRCIRYKSDVARARAVNERLKTRYDADVMPTHEKQHAAAITAAQSRIEL
jgi:hypothetical protein